MPPRSDLLRRASRRSSGVGPMSQRGKQQRPSQSPRDHARAGTAGRNRTRVASRLQDQKALRSGTAPQLHKQREAARLRGAQERAKRSDEVAVAPRSFARPRARRRRWDGDAHVHRVEAGDVLRPRKRRRVAERLAVQRGDRPAAAVRARRRRLPGLRVRVRRRSRRGRGRALARLAFGGGAVPQSAPGLGRRGVVRGHGAARRLRLWRVRTLHRGRVLRGPERRPSRLRPGLRRGAGLYEFKYHWRRRPERVGGESGGRFLPGVRLRRLGNTPVAARVPER
mmetsp:Transcript_19251/g.59251  ORF Transcript_19251/g.59251 Transcript_19251/m.59251 type:complete len:282 (+) Transcript_19251:68-913(+)